MTKIAQRRATAADFAAANPILDDGEFGIEVDTKIYKVGDGVTHWNSLNTPYIPSNIFTSRGDLIVGGVGVSVADYKTKTAAASAHAPLESASHASSTFMTKNDASIAHAIHITSAQATSDYITPAAMAAATEHKDFIAFKDAEQVVTNSVTKVADTVLQFPCASNTQYIFELYLTVKGTTANGLSLAMSFPSGATIIFGAHSLFKAGGASQGNMRDAVSGTNIDVGLNGGTPLFVTIRGTIFTVATAGTCGLMFAQTTAAAGTSATIMQNSYIKAIKV